jgi:hypothetical protein
VHERRHTAPKHLAGATAPEIELMVFDVARPIRERSAIETDHTPPAVQVTRQPPSEPTANAGDDDGTLVSRARVAQ